MQLSVFPFLKETLPDVWVSLKGKADICAFLRDKKINTLADADAIAERCSRVHGITFDVKRIMVNSGLSAVHLEKRHDYLHEFSRDCLHMRIELAHVASTMPQFVKTLATPEGLSTVVPVWWHIGASFLYDLLCKPGIDQAHYVKINGSGGCALVAKPVLVSEFVQRNLDVSWVTVSSTGSPGASSANSSPQSAHEDDAGCHRSPRKRPAEGGEAGGGVSTVDRARGCTSAELREYYQGAYDDDR
jgi:hypothetical protein